MTGPTRVMVVDDDPEVRRSIAAVLASDDSLVLVAEAGDGRQALSRAVASQPDVILLDVRMPRLGGLSTLEQLSAAGHNARVLILTTFRDRDYVRRAIEGGADGFLLKSGDPRDLLRAVHGSAENETWLSPSVARILADDTRSQADDRRASAEAHRKLNGLSPRELEVTRHLARGETNADIAAALCLTESTIKSYVSSAMTRLDVRNRVQVAALVWAADSGGAGAEPRRS